MSPKIDLEKKAVTREDEGRWIKLVCKCKGLEICLFNIYAPNEDDCSFYVQIMEILDNTECTDIMIGGDFNLVMNPEIDRKGSLFNHHRAAAFLNDICQEHYTDIWRECYPESRTYSWQAGRGKKYKAARLDFFLVNHMLRTRIANVYYKPGILTDHSQIIIEGLWKLNSVHLSNSDYQTGIAYVVEKANIKYKECTDDTKWEMIKTEIISFSQMYARQKAMM